MIEMSTSESTPSCMPDPPAAEASVPDGQADQCGGISRATALRWLAIILAVAAVLRSVGLTYQLPVPTGPDPEGLINVALRMGTGDLNPHFFTWPAAPFYFLAACYGAMFAVCRALGVVGGVSEFKQWFLDDPSAFYLFTRMIMVTVGLISVAVLYRVGCLLGSRRQGLLAAAMLAVTPVEVIFCHYQKAEPLLVLTTLLALAALIRWWQRDSAGHAALAAAAIGLACAVKYNAVLLVAPAVATWVHHALGSCRGQWLRLLIGRLALGIVCLLAVFFALNPYLLIDAQDALRQLAGQRQLMQGGRGGLHDTPVRSYLTVLLPTGLGWVLCAVYGAGLCWALVGAIRRRGYEILLVVFVLAYAAAMMSQKLVTVYYPLPMVPALALGSAGLICELSRRTRLATWAAGLLLLVPAGRSLVLDYRLALPGPKFRAEYWIRDNVPAGDRLAHRHWLPPLVSAHRRRIGCYAWPQEVKIRREQVEAFVDRGVRWMVLGARNTAGRELELFGPDDAPLAREVRRFEAPPAIFTGQTVGIVVWQVSRPAKVPPLAQVYGDPNAAAPRRRLGVVFEGNVELLGVDPLDDAPMKPGTTVELCTYWRVPADASKRLLVTGEIQGSGGFLGDLTHEFAYGIEPFVGRPNDRACVVADRILIRPGLRARFGEYDVRLGLRDADRRVDLSIVKGSGTGSERCTVARIAVRP